jgi:hypothetical protein
MLSWCIKELLKSFSHFLAEAIRPVTSPAVKSDREILKVEVKYLMLEDLEHEKHLCLLVYDFESR